MAKNLPMVSAARLPSPIGSSRPSSRSTSSSGRVRACQAGVWRAAAIIAASSSGPSPNGIHPSASSTARRSERRERPPIQNGTWLCTPQGSMMKPE